MVTKRMLRICWGYHVERCGIKYESTKEYAMKVGEKIQILFSLDIPTKMRAAEWKLIYDPEYVDPTDISEDEGIQIEVSQEDCDIPSSQTIVPFVKHLNPGEIGCTFSIRPGAEPIDEGEKSIFRVWLIAKKAGNTELKYKGFYMLDVDNETIQTEESGGQATKIEAMKKGRLILIIEN